MMGRAATEGRCRKCGSTVLWARGEDGRRISLDPEPRTDGELILIGTERGKLLAFVERWRISKGKDGFSGDGYYGYPYSGRAAEQIGLYVPHSCTREPEL